MRIEREINGCVIAFELTSDEVYSAYLEQEHIYDRQDVMDEIDNYNYSDQRRADFEKEYGVPFEKVYGNDELIDNIAFESRHNQDKYGQEWTAARDDALKDVLDEYKKTLASENITLLKTEAVAFKYKGVVFDEWTIDEETGGIWGQVCKCCTDKFGDLLKDELDENGGVGACSVKDCGVVGLDSDTEMFYIDFKPELIVPLNKEQLLALETPVTLESQIAAAEEVAGFSGSVSVKEKVEMRER